MLRKNWLILAAIIYLVTSSAFAMTIKDAAQHAVSSNPNVLRAVKECLAAKQEWKAAYGPFFPSVDLSAGYGVERSRNQSTVNRPGGRDTLSRREFQVSATQMLFDGLATPNNVRRTRAKADAFAWAVVGEANDVALRTAEAYINVLRQKELLAFANENLGIFKRTSAMIDKRSESGVSRKTDAVQARGRLAQARSNLKIEEGHLRDAEIAFFRVVGKDAARLKFQDVNERYLPGTQKRAIGIALENHPRLKSANSDIKERLSQYDHSDNPFFPHVDAVFEMNKNHNMDGIRGPNDDYMLMLRGRWNIFRGGSDIARKRETAYLAQEAAEIRNRTYRQIVENASLTWVAYRNNKRLLPDYKIHAEAAKSTIDAYGKQFQLGERTLLDLLNSENEYFASQRIYINTKYDFMIAKYRLLNTMGRLLSYLNIDMDKIGGYEGMNELLKVPSQRPKEVKIVKATGTNGHKDTSGARRLAAGSTGKSQTAGAKVVPQRVRGALPDIDVTKAPFTIQLLATGQERALKQFIQEHELGKSASYFQTERRGKPWFVLVYGEYPSQHAALEAIKSLPEGLRVFKPWPRTIGSVKHAQLRSFSKNLG